jgi:hypothetical protein
MVTTSIALPADDEVTVYGPIYSYPQRRVGAERAVSSVASTGIDGPRRPGADDRLVASP